MIESETGRTDRAEIGDGRIEARGATEAQDGDVREPRTLLAPVHPEPLEALVHPLRDPRRRQLAVVEDDHADAPRLAVPPSRELDRTHARGGVAELGDNRRNVLRRPGPEKGNGDV